MNPATWQKLREDYPLIIKGTYLKSASISAVHPDVLEEMKKWLTSVAEQAAIDEGRFFDFLMESREVLGRFLKCPPEDVTLLENSSHNMNLVAMMLKKDHKEGRIEVVVPADEFPSSVLPFYHHGFEVIQVPSEHGHLTEEKLFAAVNDKTAALITSHVQFSSGLRLNLKKLSDLAEEKAVPLILNTTQSLGVFEVDLSQLKVAALTSSCHKWLGAGIGQAILYLSPEFRAGRPFPFAGWCSVAEPFNMVNEKPIPRDDVGALQLGSLPFALIAGVIKAIQLIESLGVANIQKQVLELSHQLRLGIKELGYQPFGAHDLHEESGIVTFPVDDADDLVEFLDHKKIYVNNRRGSIRASVHFYNNKSDVETFLKALEDYSSKRKR